MKFRSYYSNPPVDPGIRFDEVLVDKVTGEEIPLTPSMAVQSEADACDINKIMERFNRTGVLPVKYNAPSYGDARVPDFQTARQLIIDAENQFQALPAKTREKYSNRVEVFSKAMDELLTKGVSENEAKELLELGIIIERPTSDSDVLREIAKNTKKEEVQK